MNNVLLLCVGLTIGSVLVVCGTCVWCVHTILKEFKREHRVLRTKQNEVVLQHPIERRLCELETMRFGRDLKKASV